MPIAQCRTAVDSTQRELVEHGTLAFPMACYHDDLSRDQVPWHWHEELEAAVITHGTAVVAAGNEKYILHAGEGFFINSGILHGCWDLDASASRFHSIVFHPRLVGGSLDSVFYRDYIHPLTENHALESLHLKPAVPWQREALEAIEGAWQACAGEARGYEFRARSQLSELVVLLGGNIPSAGTAPGPKARRDNERIKQMLAYIHDHWAEELSTKTIARHAAISESECLRCFRATIGTTPIQYVRQYRIQRAAQLLSGTGESIAAISEQCGFQDVSYFTKTFRELKGCPPAAYRRREQADDAL